MTQLETTVSQPKLNQLKIAFYLRDRTIEILAQNPDNLGAQKFQTIMEDFILAVATAESVSLQLFEKIAHDLDAFEAYKAHPTGPQGVLIGTVGYENAGKDQVSQTLTQEFGFEPHTLSDRLKDVAAIKGDFPPFDRDYLSTLSKESKAVFGNDYLIWVTAFLFYKPDASNHLVIDGLRMEEEAEALKSFENNQVAIIAVLTDLPELPKLDDLIDRYIRSLGRGGAKDPKENTEANFEKFEELSEREAPNIKKTIEKYADFKIANRTNQQADTKRQLIEVMEQLHIQKAISPA